MLAGFKRNWSTQLRRGVSIFSALALTMAGGIVATVSFAGSASAAKPLLSLNIGETLISPTNSNLLVAEDLGFFKAAGVNVDVHVNGSVATAQAAAGQLDLVQSGVSGAVAPTVAGQPCSIVYQESQGNGTAAVMVAANSPITSIMGLSGDSISVLGAGTSTYGAALVYSKYIVSQGGKALNLISASSSAEQISDVVSGIAQASIGLVDIFAPAVAANQIKVLVDPTSSIATKLFPANLVNIGWWGLTSQIKKQRGAIIDFIAGMRAADLWIQTATAAQLAKVDFASGYFVGETEAQVLSSIPNDRPFFTKQGFITAPNWADTLTFLSGWLPTADNIGSGQFAYSQSFINMNLWNAATKDFNAVVKAKKIKETSKTTPKLVVKKPAKKKTA